MDMLPALPVGLGLQTSALLQLPIDESLLFVGVAFGAGGHLHFILPL